MSDFVSGKQPPFLSSLKLPQPSTQPLAPTLGTTPPFSLLKPPVQLFQPLPTDKLPAPNKSGNALTSFAFSDELEQIMGVAVAAAQQEWDKGVKETPGKPNRGKEVDKYAAAVGGIVGETWCGYFLGYCYDKAGMQDTIALASTYRAQKFFSEPGSDRLFLDIGETFNPSQSKYTYSNLPIQPGDVVIFNEKGDSHLGMVESYHAQTGKLVTIEGNSGGGTAKKGDGSDTQVVRDGNSVVRKVYDLSLKYIRDKITAFGRPALKDFVK